MTHRRRQEDDGEECEYGAYRRTIPSRSRVSTLESLERHHGTTLRYLLPPKSQRGAVSLPALRLPAREHARHYDEKQQIVLRLRREVILENPVGRVVNRDTEPPRSTTHAAEPGDDQEWGQVREFDEEWEPVEESDGVRLSGEGDEHRRHRETARPGEPRVITVQHLPVLNDVLNESGVNPRIRGCRHGIDRGGGAVDEDRQNHDQHNQPHGTQWRSHDFKGKGNDDQSQSGKVGPAKNRDQAEGAHLGEHGVIDGDEPKNECRGSEQRSD